MNLWRQVAIGGAWAHVTCGPPELVIGLAWGLPALAAFGVLSTALGAWILLDARRCGR